MNVSRYVMEFGKSFVECEFTFNVLVQSPLANLEKILGVIICCVSIANYDILFADDIYLSLLFL